MSITLHSLMLKRLMLRADRRYQAYLIAQGMVKRLSEGTSTYVCERVEYPKNTTVPKFNYQDNNRIRTSTEIIVGDSKGVTTVVYVIVLRFIK
ncbi:MAG: hypothetical protein ACK5LG_21830 [Bacteroides thetaiotaomicron]